MPRLSILIARPEDWLAPKCRNGFHCLEWIGEQQYKRLRHRGRIWYVTHKKRLGRYIVLGLLIGYSYGILLNSVQLGTAATFYMSGAEAESIWVSNSFQNWFILLTLFGLGATTVLVLPVRLITRKGYIFLSGYKFIRDLRGFDILPDATHGPSGFLTEQGMCGFLEVGPAAEVCGMMLGKVKQREKDPDQLTSYVVRRMVPGDNNNLLCIGVPGSGKSRGFIIPLLMGCVQRTRSGHPESVIVTDPKEEPFEKMALHFRKNEFNVKAINFLDMVHSDGWNCLYSLDQETQLVQTVASIIIQNTLGPKEADNFWSRAELNLLIVLICYVCNLKDDAGNPLPTEQRGLGDVYHLLAERSIQEINQILAALSPEYLAEGHHGLFLKVRENLRGNIAIGPDNRLAIFQNALMDEITRNHDVDLLLPGQKPCTYFVIIPAQDSAYRFLSSLFFSLAFPRLSDYAQPHDKNGHLKVLVNFCLNKCYNTGYIEGISDVFNSVRGFNMSCQVVVQNLSQRAEKHPGKDWENQLNTFDRTLYMGCNDLSSAEYVSKKCGMATISVTNNQTPLTPLFSPVYSSTRAYSQTRSNIQWALMQLDEILRLGPGKCIVLFNRHKLALLCKLAPEEPPGYGELKPYKVIRYVPVWAKREKRSKARGWEAVEPTGAERGWPPQVVRRELLG